MRRAATIGLSLVGTLLLAGCNDVQTIDASSGAPRIVRPVAELVARSNPPIPDLPVPYGFGIDENKSRDYAFAGGRFVDHLYKGRKDKLAVKRFYERQMPINRWVLSSAKFIRGDVCMDFEKETERCRISITDGSWFHRTYIKVELWPSGRVQAPAGE